MTPFWFGFVTGLWIGPFVLIVGVSVYALARQLKPAPRTQRASL